MGWYRLPLSARLLTRSHFHTPARPRRLRYQTMETLTFHPEASSERGFSMVEVLIAMFVLSTGLIALSSLAAQNLGGTARSRYISLASTYASEKLEDLNQWPTTDPDVCVSS